MRIADSTIRGSTPLAPLGKSTRTASGLELTDPDATVKPGALVHVKVHCQWRTGAWWVKRKLSEALDIGLY